MKPRNSISNTQGQVFLFRMASFLARTSLGLVCANFVRTLLGFVCALLSFSLKGFIFITAGERSVTCGKKVMTPTNIISNTQEHIFLFRMASCLAMTKCVCHGLVHLSTRSPVHLFPHFLIYYYNFI